MDESKAVLLGLSIVMGGIVLVGITIGVYERGRDLIDAAAPVVESCVKHPATRSPFKAHP